MKGFGVVTVVDELVGNLLSLAFCATENYGVYPWIIVDDALQGKIFILGID